VEDLQRSIESLGRRCFELDALLEAERREREKTAAELQRWHLRAVETEKELELRATKHSRKYVEHRQANEESDSTHDWVVANESWDDASLPLSGLAEVVASSPRSCALGKSNSAVRKDARRVSFDLHEEAVSGGEESSDCDSRQAACAITTAEGSPVPCRAVAPQEIRDEGGYDDDGMEAAAMLHAMLRRHSWSAGDCAPLAFMDSVPDTGACCTVEEELLHVVEVQNHKYDEPVKAASVEPVKLDDRLEGVPIQAVVPLEILEPSSAESDRMLGDAALVGKLTLPPPSVYVEIEAPPRVPTLVAISSTCLAATSANSATSKAMGYDDSMQTRKVQAVPQLALPSRGGRTSGLGSGLRLPPPLPATSCEGSVNGKVMHATPPPSPAEAADSAGRSSLTGSGGFASHRSEEALVHNYLGDSSSRSGQSETSSRLASNRSAVVQGKQPALTRSDFSSSARGSREPPYESAVAHRAALPQLGAPTAAASLADRLRTVSGGSSDSSAEASLQSMFPESHVSCAGHTGVSESLARLRRLSVKLGESDSSQM